MYSQETTLCIAPGTEGWAAVVTSRAAGRHRRRLTFPLSPVMPLLEHPGAHVRPAAQSDDRRTFTLVMSAGLAGVTAAALVGSLAPLASTWSADGGSGAMPGAAAGAVPGATSGVTSGSPQASLPWSADPLGGPSGLLVSPQPPRAGPVPASTRPLGDLTQGKGGRHRKGQKQGHGDGRSHGHSSSRPPGPPAATGTSAQARTAGSAPPVVVSYVLDREWADGFQGQVRVVNRGPQPIAGWQAVIALPSDRVTSFWNASGVVSHHIMLLRPASTAEVVPAGGTLSVFFTATGPETTPQACAFDGISCGPND